jgi:hypothetical protein
MSPEKLGLVLTVLGILSVLGGWLRWGRPRVAQAQREAVAMRDAILGRDSVRDTITGRELAPALPGIGVRMAHQEDQMRLLTDAVSKIADSHVRLENVEARVDRHDEDIAILKAASAERIIARVESSQAWQAVEAVAKSQPPNEIDE